MSEKTLGSTPVYDGKVIKLRVDDIETERGIKSKREIVSHGGGAAVLAVKDGKILMERQFRYAYGEVLWEIPAGKRDAGEDFIAAARRELEEETGIIPLELTEIFRIYPSPGYTDEVIAIYFADEFAQGKINFDDTEDLTSEWVEVDKLYEMIGRGEIRDSKTLVALLWYKSRVASV